MSGYIILDLAKYCFLKLLILVLFTYIYVRLGSLCKMFFVFFSILWVLSHFSLVQLCETLWTAAHQAPLSIGFSRQEYWSGLPCPPPGDLPTQGLNLYLYVSYTGKWVLYNHHHQGSPYYYLEETNVQKPHKQLKRSKFPVLKVKANIRYRLKLTTGLALIQQLE